MGGALGTCQWSKVVLCVTSYVCTELREKFALQPAFSLAEPGGWYDCSAEEGIMDPVFAFSAVYSDPPIVTKTRFTASHNAPSRCPCPCRLAVLQKAGHVPRGLIR